MNNHDAQIALGTLIGGTGGWGQATEQTLTIYEHNFRTLNDKDCAMAAVQDIIDTWTEARRPPWATVLTAYRSRWRDAALARPALPSGDRAIPPSEGRKFAAMGYEAECKLQGKEPNWPLFHSILREAMDDGEDPDTP